MTRILASYLGSLVAFAVLDAGWITLMAGPLYRPALGPLLAEKFDGRAAVAFYLIYTAGLAYFAVLPALRTSAWTTAALHGAMLGFVAYATYDLTNQATLRVWAFRVTVVDVAWGACASGLAATIGYGLTAWANRAAGS